MEVLRLTATHFIRPMSTGRNRPLLLGCEDSAGKLFEVVVKFRGREMNEKAQTAELIAAQLADDLGLQVPQAVVVDVPVGFEAVIPEKEFKELATMVKSSSGLNFGSVHVGSGFTTWLPGRNPHGAQRDQAAEIFAFDTLVQNPDRRAANPNLWVRSDRIGVFDHEQAFSFLFLPIIGGAPRPWSATNQGRDDSSNSTSSIAACAGADWISGRLGNDLGRSRMNTWRCIRNPFRQNGGTSRNWLVKLSSIFRKLANNERL